MKQVAMEALTLNAKKRIQLPGNLTEWFTKALAGVRQAPLTHEIAFMSCELSLHPDPADRLIAARAIVLDLTLVAVDRKCLCCHA